MIVLGVDPGLSGGLAVVAGSPVRLLEVIDVPTTGTKAKRRIETLAVMRLLQSHQIDHAYIERAQAMPKQGSSSGFIYGRAVGALEACIEGMLIPLTVIEPTAWKKAHALMKCEKEDSRQRAIRLFPGNHNFFDRKMDHNRAEAALIAWYGAMMMKSDDRASHG